MFMLILDFYILMKFKFHIMLRAFMAWLIFGNAEIARYIITWFLFLLGKYVILEAVYVENGHAINFTKQMNIILCLEEEEGCLDISRFKSNNYELDFTFQTGVKNKIKMINGSAHPAQNSFDKVPFTF